ncbi:hypothetical protein KM043_000980 [Ampulex compressa]|nr:hypothetical protein KM043_000980 [Ampulex compressa]
MELHTPKRESRPLAEALPRSPPMCDTMLYPWNWSEEARNVNLSPGSSCSSPEYREHSAVATRTCPRSRSGGSESHRRGRPRADALSNLMMQGSTSPSSIKCTYCNRVFPREKSLQAHLRTHTGERPYPCDYPGCTKAFTQSGQLKTHQRLHTGEKPFLCTEQGCEMRFTHANRHCPDHPYATLTRSDDFVLKPVSDNTELPHDVTRWLERYKMSREREDRTPTGKNERKKKSWKSSAENHKRVKSRKGLMMDVAGEQENMDRAPTNQRLYCGESQESQEESQDEDPTEACIALQTSEDEDGSTVKLAITPLRRPLDRLQPKKRWLREACLEQQLAKPLNWDVKSGGANATSPYKYHENLQWCSPAAGNLSGVAEMISSKTHKLTHMQSQIDSSYTSNRISWSMNPGSESLDASPMEEQRNTFDTSQAHWNPPRYKANTCRSLTKLHENQSDNILYWDGNHTRGTARTFHNPASPKSKNPLRREEADLSGALRSSENETRPTVLMLAGSASCGGKELTPKLAEQDTEPFGTKVVVVKQENGVTKLDIPEDNQKWLGALALMELAKTQEEAAKALGLRRKEERFSNTELNYTHL